MLGIGSVTFVTFVVLLFKWMRKKQSVVKVLLQDPNLKYEVKLIDKEVCLKNLFCSICDANFRICLFLFYLDSKLEC